LSLGSVDGETRALRDYSAAAEGKLNEYPEVKNRWLWAGERNDVPELLARNHALVLPSFYEGLPNVVCEALASARPVLLSDVGDNARLVARGERGFTFDPDSVRDIAESIGTLASITRRDWIQFGHNARRYAEENLSIDRMVGRYESLFSSIIA